MVLERLEELAAKDPAKAQNEVYSMLAELADAARTLPQAASSSELQRPSSNRTEEWLEFFRRKFDLSVVGLAKRLDMTPATIYGWRTRGKIAPKRIADLDALLKRLS